jgi:CRISPR-associated protein Csh1
MIQQFAELGRYFRERAQVADPLEQLAQNPGQKFGRNVLLLIFSENGFERVQPESYDEEHRLRYLYREGPPNKWDKTPTTRMPHAKESSDSKLLSELHTRLARLGDSVRDALKLGENLSEEEAEQLRGLSKALPTKERKNKDANPANERLRQPIIAALQAAHPNPKEKGFMSVAWSRSDGTLKFVGDFEAFKQQVRRAGVSEKDDELEQMRRGQCSVCGANGVGLVADPLKVQVPNFEFYIVDKPGSVSGGFDKAFAWRNFPVCSECSSQLDFSGERLKRELEFDWYRFKYLVLPSTVKPQGTEAFNFLRHLTRARVDNKISEQLRIAEDDIFETIADEDNRLHLDLLFYHRNQQYFRPALYIPGLRPTWFRELLDTKQKVDAHPWLRAPSPNTFTKDTFTFGSLRNVFPSKAGGSSYDDEFLAATRAALEKRAFSTVRLLAAGMRLIQQDYLQRKHWQLRLADLFRTLLFFDLLTGKNPTTSSSMINIDYGSSPQADRVRALFAAAPGRLQSDPSAQAAFLLGAACGRIENIQERVNRQLAGEEVGRGASPFAGKYKGFRLSQPEMQRLFVDAKDKARAYGLDEESKVAPLLKCVGAALLASPDRWSLSPDEISYYFALGHTLRSRLVETKEEDSENNKI